MRAIDVTSTGSVQVTCRLSSLFILAKTIGRLSIVVRLALPSLRSHNNPFKGKWRQGARVFDFSASCFGLAGKTPNAAGRIDPTGNT
jgi:hypothetical protein